MSIEFQSIVLKITLTICTEIEIDTIWFKFNPHSLRPFDNTSPTYFDPLITSVMLSSRSPEAGVGTFSRDGI